LDVLKWYDVFLTEKEKIDKKIEESQRDDLDDSNQEIQDDSQNRPNEDGNALGSEDDAGKARLNQEQDEGLAFDNSASNKSEEIYIVETFTNQKTGKVYNYCRYKGAKALFDSNEHVGKGDKIRFTNATPIENNLEDDFLKKMYHFRILSGTYVII
jgi:hypothetical protein